MNIFYEYPDYSGKKVLIGLSGGINSAAVLCWLAESPKEKQPAELHLFYAHFEEHSPDTLDFVLDCKQFAVNTFKKVIYTQTDNSVLDYFEKLKMIPHPTMSPCSVILKIKPINDYIKANQIDVDLIGYVKDEIRRAKRAKEKGAKLKEYPILDLSNEECFILVKKHIGWYPKIYDITHKGRRVFKHNNCLPCKNMSENDFKNVEKHFPDYWGKALKLSEALKKHWGRDAEAFYTDFADHFNLEGNSHCDHCQL